MPSLTQVQAQTEPPPETHPCGDCGEDISLDVCRCDTCQEDYYECAGCSDEYHVDDISYVNDESYCQDCFYEYNDYCYGCGDAHDRDDMYYRNEEYYCDSCVPSEDDCVDRLENLSVPSSARSSSTFNYLDVKRYVGIEAECQYPSDVSSIDYPSGWTHCYDGSINADTGYSGTEMVSKPADGDALYDTVNSLCDWAYRYEARVNRSCGLHIHFNSLDLNARQIASIGIVYKILEDTIYNMMPPSRKKANWCKRFPISYTGLRDVAKYNCEQTLVDYYYSDYGASTEKYNDSRYHGLNLHARYYHGTIEFRHHSGTLNKEKILNWIKICNAIIETGIRLSSSSSKIERLYNKNINTIKRYVLGTELIKYVNKRTAKFRTEGE